MSRLAMLWLGIHGKCTDLVVRDEAAGQIPVCKVPVTRRSSRDAVQRDGRFR